MAKNMAITTLKKFAVLSMVVLSLLSITPAQAVAQYNQRANWILFSPPGGGFYTRMPGMPVRGVMRVSEGNLTYYQYNQDTPYGRSIYQVGYLDLPSVQADVESFLSQQFYNYAVGLNGTVVDQVKLYNKSYPALAARVEGSEASALLVASLVNKRLYIVAFVTNKTESFPEEATQFLDSFAPIWY
jgi:hypothetical protein